MGAALRTIATMAWGVVLFSAGVEGWNWLAPRLPPTVDDRRPVEARQLSRVWPAGPTLEHRATVASFEPARIEMLGESLVWTRCRSIAEPRHRVLPRIAFGDPTVVASATSFPDNRSLDDAPEMLTNGRHSHVSVWTAEPADCVVTAVGLEHEP